MNSNANVMDTVNETMQSVEESTRSAARARLETTLNAAKASLHNGKERMTTTARHAVETTDQYVHTNPWSAIGIAAAAGAATAVLLRRRMHR